MALLNVENLSFTYAGKEQPVLQGISFAVEKGQLVAVCGPTGSGKSSLLRLLKRELTPLGQKTGRILFENVPLEDLSDREAAFRIGYVMQRPEEQIVTDKVWHELAFGLENMNVPQSVIARRIAEIAVYFGIEDWYDKPVSQLSGGQKQMLNLAAVMVLQPEVLILDEPTAQLDPVAASRFIQTLYKLNRELGLTVIIAEHRLEEIIPCCDRMLALEKGSMICYDTPQSVAAGLDKNLDLLCAMPAATRIYHLLEAKGDCPLDVRQGREFIQKRFSNNTRSLPEEKSAAESKAALEFEDVFFRYERNSPDVLKGLSFTARENEIYCILGQNASGKTTMLSVAAGINRAYSGKVKVFGKQIKEYKNQSLYRECLTLLPQDVQTMFLRNTVGEELDNAREGLELLPFDISHLFGQHPYDLSGGEQQLAALAKALATKPKLLLMDEPTKGIDAAAKEKLVKVLKNLKERGMTIVVVTHDVEFAAACADRCAMFFRGSIVSEGTPRNFFHENHFFTTAISRMTRGYFDYAVTAEDAFALCRINGEKGGKE